MENGAMEETDLKWRKASYSSNGGGNCIEVGKGGRVLVRDTKDRSGPVLRLSPAAWRRFADQVKRSLAPGADDVRKTASHDRAGVAGVARAGAAVAGNAGVAGPLSAGRRHLGADVWLCVGHAGSGSRDGLSCGVPVVA
jgi:hypothetical protein